MKKAVIYIRIKTDLMDDSVNGVSTQVQQCKAYAEANGLSIVGIYSDIRVYGSKEDYIDWKAILNNMTPFYEYVLISDIARIGRNYGTVIADLKRLQKHGVKVISVAGAEHDPLLLAETFKL